jgi:hypothetical protein
MKQNRKITTCYRLDLKHSDLDRLCPNLCLSVSLSVSLFLSLYAPDGGGAAGTVEWREGNSASGILKPRRPSLPFTSLHFTSLPLRWWTWAFNRLTSPPLPACSLPPSPPATVSYSLVVPGNVISSMDGGHPWEWRVWESSVLDHTPHLTQVVIAIWLHLHVLSPITTCRGFRLPL